MKKIITILLLLFVGASVVKVVVDARQSDDPVASTADVAKDTQTIVYYFHGKVRCKTCNTIEAYTKNTMESEFSDEMNNGELVVRVINMEENKNEHYVKDYELTSSSVVVSRVKDGKEVKWKRLDEVWDLVHDEPAFTKYIGEQTHDIIEGDQ